jgi:hypothetical protein
MRGLATALVALLVLAGLFSYLGLPVVIEDQLAQRLREGFGSPAEPAVEVSSSFPPELLLGRVKRIEVGADWVGARPRPRRRPGGAEGRERLRGEPPTGDLRVETQSCSLSAEAPAVSIDQDRECLTYLGLNGG